MFKKMYTNTTFSWNYVFYLSLGIVYNSLKK